ncbi:MAG: RNA polymerase sigma factor [Planctomycetaceae bacterium]|nr:RNA polymerase sigma factor [Planctomycetaceae bacterium]
MDGAPETRASLILRLHDRDDLDAWQEFSEIYHPLVFRLARSKGFQHSDALDVAQEVLLRVAGAVERWEPDPEKGTFRGWLYRIARNLMIDFLERGRRSPLCDADHLIEMQVDPSSLESRTFDLAFQRQVFLWAADRIRPAFQEPTWQAFWQTAVVGESVAVVAEELDMSVGAVYIARTRVMQKLRTEVQRVIQDVECREVPA